MTSAVRAPRRSSSAFVATVVPCASTPTASASIPTAASAATTPARLVARRRRHLRGHELAVDDRDEVGERAADVDADRDICPSRHLPEDRLATAMATTKMPSSLEIAQQATLRPIAELAEEIGLEDDEVELYGRYKAKVDLSVLDRLARQAEREADRRHRDHADEGGRGQDDHRGRAHAGARPIGKSPVLCLREASLGPVFGIKGGAAGGGYAQVVPMEDLNLHFTGDIHAIGAANNLLSAMLEAHILHGNALGIDPLTISWRRCLDMNDRALRNVVLGLGGRANGYVRETGFDITAASEVMAIAAVARDLFDLRKRLGAITVAYTWDGEPVTAEQLKAAGAMTVLLKDAIKPNLVQTLEGQPAFIHCGPFANIAHGNSSLVADLVGAEARRLRRHRVAASARTWGWRSSSTSSAGSADIAPSAIVLVATVRALKHHGGDPDGGLEAIERGADNLARHIGIVREFGLNAVVAVNRFPGDTDEEIETVRRLALELGAHAAAVNSAFEGGGEGARELAEAVVDAAEQPTRSSRSTRSTRRSPRRSRRSRSASTGPTGSTCCPPPRTTSSASRSRGSTRVPICMAKTHLSLSHDPEPDRTRRPASPCRCAPPRLHGRRLARRALRRHADDARASATPAAFNVDIDENGRTVGLF